MTAEAYTAPERSCERAVARRMLAKISGNPCGYCMHRVEGWGRVACDQPHRTFPRCLSTPGISFEPDYVKLQGVGHAPNE